MSADNGVYILCTKNEWRVAHAQAIENIDYFPECSLLGDATLVQVFGLSKVFTFKDAACDYAFDLADKIDKEGYLEYGISIIHREWITFPTMSFDEAARILDDYWLGRDFAEVIEGKK